MTEALMRRWDEEMVQIYKDAKAIGYPATRFIQMVHASGGLPAAKTLISAERPSDGFTKLWELRRLDISVEARALKPEYAALFSAAELATCRQRLEDYRWAHQPPWKRPR